MAVTSVKEIWEGRKASVDVESRARKYTRVWRVITNNPLDDAFVVTAPYAIPRLLAPYVTAETFDRHATVRSISPEQDQDHPRVWKITVEYSSGKIGGDAAVNADAGGQPGGESEANPLERPPVISYNTVKVQKPYRFDVNNKPVANSAFEPYDPLPERDQSRIVITIQRNEFYYDAQQSIDYQDTINQNPFRGFSKGLVKCDSITGQNQYESDIYFWSVTYQFTVNWEGWMDKTVDQGFWEIDGAGKPKQITVKGIPVSTPRWLDGAGHVLPINGPNVTPVPREFQPYRYADFVVFGLG